MSKREKIIARRVTEMLKMLAKLELGRTVAKSPRRKGR